MNKEFILGSGSPRRIQLLTQIGLVPSKIMKADIDETPFKGEAPRAYVKRMAKAKNDALLEQMNGKLEMPLLTADTIVCLGKRILGKPESKEQAKAYLSLLSGRRHTVMGAIFLRHPDGTCVKRLVETKVLFKRLSPVELKAYVETGDSLDKAGAYGVQGLAGAFIKTILGSYTNVVGLDLYTVKNMLQGSL
ncbi:MAG: Maf family protein [Alphaproteobacteria bacterium]|nr:Maf family protein [Alphaproteobacteria bacterium]